jgi:hypothetical protein
MRGRRRREKGGRKWTRKEERRGRKRDRIDIGSEVCGRQTHPCEVAYEERVLPVWFSGVDGGLSTGESSV